MATPDQMRALLSVADRFWPRVDFSGDCWLWTGATVSGGYGQVYLWGGRKNRHSMQAHRFSLSITDCPPLPTETVDHLCRVHLCVNPAHLEAVTTQVNTLRGYGRAATQARRTTCPEGHPYDYVSPDGRRRCRPCDRAKTKIREANRGY